MAKYPRREKRERERERKKGRMEGRCSFFLSLRIVYESPVDFFLSSLSLLLFFLYPLGFVAYLNARYVCNMAMSARISRVHRGAEGVTTQSPEIPLSSFLRFYYTLAAISLRRPFDEP